MRAWVWPFLVVLALGGIGLSFLASPPATELGSSDIRGYRVVYRIEDRAGAAPRVTTETVEVRRPYDGRVEQRPGSPPGGDVTSGNVTNRDHFWQLTDGGALQFGVDRKPAGPARDGSHSALRDAADAGVVDAIGAGEVLGHRCAWFGYAEPAPQSLSRPSADSRVESCVDRNGIVLEEVWRLAGRVARIIEAVELSTEPPPVRRFLGDRDPSSERVQQSEASALLMGRLAVSDQIDGVDEPSIEVHPPRGWRLDRRVVVAESGGAGAASQAIVETYTRGWALVVVERGTHPSYVPPWPVDEGVLTERGSFGRGRTVYFADRVEFRLAGDLGYVRISAPSRGFAISFARRLRASAG